MDEPLRLFEIPKPAPDPVIARAPIGVVVETDHGVDGDATATYDETGQYRYRLSRVWDSSKKRCVFIMLNPSTATASVVDNTVAKCIKYAKDRGFGALEVVNIFAYRSTDPKNMYKHPDPVGPGNDQAIEEAAKAGHQVIAAWGVHSELNNRSNEVRALLNNIGVELYCLKVTKDGHPGHPLYVPGKVDAFLWSA